MARYTGPKNRLSRREGVDLFGKGTKLRRSTVPPGQHGPKGTRRVSDYGAQLREKQKARHLYGVLERQFKKYFKKALKFKGNTGEALFVQLERRLDNVVYRLSLAPTRAAARQLVSHRHVHIDNKKINIPSYQVNVNEVVSLSARALEIPTIKKMLQDKNPVVPAWLERQGAMGKIRQIPTRDQVQTDIDESLIVEYYSR